MSRLLILGAGGSLGRHVVRQALAAGHDVTAFIRTSSGLQPDLLEHVSVYTGDLSAGLPADIVRGQDALLNCAGHVRDGHTFVRLVDRIVTSVDMLPAGEQHNFERLQASRLDWRLLCPRPMVEEPGVGLDRLRIFTDTLPVEIPAVMLANIARDNEMSSHRIGLARRADTT